MEEMLVSPQEEIMVDDLGYDLFKVKIKKVRLSPMRGKWYVEYQLKKSKFFIFDKYWWYDDSLHSNYSDAAVRANVLTSLGYIEVLKKKKTKVFEVKQPPAKL